MLPGHLDDGVCGNNLAAVLPSAEGTALFYRGRKFTVGLACLDSTVEPSAPVPPS